jgi:staphylococcal nuclease domain-containing protein 1
MSEDSQTFVTEWKGKSLDGKPFHTSYDYPFDLLKLAIVEQVRDGTTLRVRLFMPDGDHQIVNIALAGVRSARPSSKQGEPSDPWGEEVCSCCNFRNMLHILSSRPNFSLNLVCCNVRFGYKYYLYLTQLPHHSNRGQVLLRSHQLAYLLAQVNTTALIFFVCKFLLSQLVLHPAGNVAEHLVAAGLARVVDWHAGMLASTGGMERLRAAEKTAKEKRACLYANLPAVAANGNGLASANGSSKVFDATVIRIWSGDQLSVVEKGSRKERRLQLSSTRGPK